MANATRRKAQAVQYAQSATLWGVDGLSLDVEYDGQTGWDRDLLTAFTCDLRNALRAANPAGRLTFASSVLPALDGERYDYAKLAACVDFFTPMAYHTPVNTGNTSLAASFAQYEALGVAASKLVPTFAWFGQDTTVG